MTAERTPVSSGAALKTFGRKLGYCISVAVNGVMLYLVNVSPGWEAVPFLNDKTVEIIPLINFSLILGIFLNLVYTLYEPAPLKALGEVVTTGITLTILFRVLNVFPFDLDGDWASGLRVSLVLVALCVLIALIVQSVKLIRTLLGTHG